MVRDIVESKLASNELVHARTSLDQFNGALKDAIQFAIPQSDDDLAHSQVSHSSLFPFPTGLKFAEMFFVELGNSVRWLCEPRWSLECRFLHSQRESAMV